MTHYQNFAPQNCVCPYGRRMCVWSLKINRQGINSMMLKKPNKILKNSIPNMHK